jgi:hypothetical protein
VNQQHPPAHQLAVLSTGWGRISHPMGECAFINVDFFGADSSFFFLFFFFFLLGGGGGFFFFFFQL